MRTKERFYEDDSMYIVKGEFKNDSGDTFIIYELLEIASLYNQPSVYFITGDELEWEDGYSVDRKGNVYQEFLTSKEEKESIKKILK